MALHEEPAPEGMWEGIEQRIIAGNMPLKKAVVTRRLWAWRTGVVAVAAAVAILLIFVVRFNPADTPTGELFTEEKVTTPPQPALPQWRSHLLKTGRNDPPSHMLLHQHPHLHPHRK